MAAKKAEEKEVVKTIKWLPPYTDDDINFGPATGKPDDPEMIMYKPGNQTAPTKQLRATGRIVMTLPEIIADNYLTHPVMRFIEVPDDTPAEAEKPLTFDMNVTRRPEPAQGMANPESVSTEVGTDQHVSSDPPTS